MNTWLAIIFLFGLLCHPAAVLSAKEIDIEGITVFADTKVKDGGATIRADLGPTSLRELGEVDFRLPDGNSALPPPSEPMTALVFVPNTVSEEIEAEFGEGIRQQLLKKRPNINLQIVRIDIKKEKLRAEEMSAEIAHAMNSVEENQAEIKEIAAAMIDANRNTTNALVDWSNEFIRRVNEMKSKPEAQSLFVGSLIGMASTIGPATVFLSTTGANFFGIAQVIYAGVFDQINSTFSTRVIKFEDTHRFPWWKKKFLVRFYNNHFFARALAVNFTLQAYQNFSYRLFAHAADPTNIASPMGWEYLLSAGGLAFTSSLATSGTDIGVRSLRKKGYISQRAELFTNSVLNLITQINGAMLGSGFMDFLPYGFAVEWGTKGILGVMGRYLPTRGNRFVLLHPAIPESDANNLKYIYDLQEAVKVRDMTFADARAMLDNLEIEATRIQKAIRLRASMQIYYERMQMHFVQIYRYACDQLMVLRKMIFIE